MKCIDERAQPLVASLIEGHASRLDAADQTRVAAWAAVIAVLGRFVHPQPEHVVPSWVTWLYKHHGAHPSWQIWIGHYEGSKRTWYGARYLRMTSPERRIEYGVQTTLVVGKLTVQIRGMDCGIRLPAPTPVQLQQIWPAIGYVEWPPQQVYDDATVESLADRFTHARRSASRSDDAGGAVARRPFQ